MDENRLTADVLLAITDASTGAPVIDSAHLRPLLAGTAITELVLRGALTLTQGGRFGVGRVPMPVDARWTDVVQRALGRTPTSAITRVAGSAAWHDRTLALRAAAGKISPFEAWRATRRPGCSAFSRGGAWRSCARMTAFDCWRACTRSWPQIEARATTMRSPRCWRPEGRCARSSRRATGAGSSTGGPASLRGSGPDPACA